MTRFRYALFVCPVVCALAQTPPAPASRQATPVPPPAQETTETPKLPTFPIPPPPVQVPPETVILTVGDFKLTAGQFDAIAEILPEQSKTFVRGPGRYKFAEQIAKVMVLSEEARRRKLDQSPDFALQSAYRTNEWLSTLAENAIRDSIKIDDASVKAYYEAHKAQYERVHARHILIRVQGSPAPLKPGAKDLTDAEGLAKAQELLQRIKSGEDFAQVAAAESDDNGAATNGGDLGWFGHGKVLPSIEEAAFTLESGQVSQPIQSAFGYHIVQVIGQEFKSLEEVRPGIEKQLLPPATQKAIDELEKNVKIDYDATFFGLPKQ
jgi:hypothetical protein